MYVCMYVYMYACMYVYMYVCMYVCIQCNTILLTEFGYVYMYVCTYVSLQSETLPTELHTLYFLFPFTNYTIGAMRSSPFVFVNRKMEGIKQALIEIKRVKF